MVYFLPLLYSRAMFAYSSFAFLILVASFHQQASGLRRPSVRSAECSWNNNKLDWNRRMPCWDLGGICVYSSLCRGQRLGTEQEQGTLCPADSERTKGICCLRNDTANGRCREIGGECMGWCGIYVRLPATGCKNCNMCCILVL